MERLFLLWIFSFLFHFSCESSTKLDQNIFLLNVDISWDELKVQALNNIDLRVVDSSQKESLKEMINKLFNQNFFQDISKKSGEAKMIFGGALLSCGSLLGCTVCLVFPPVWIVASPMIGGGLGLASTGIIEYTTSDDDDPSDRNRGSGGFEIAFDIISC